jgi:outer membrane protein OmpA-like peptidoglycan-associated protein
MKRCPAAALLVILFLFSLPSIAQRSKGDQSFKNYEYRDAIKYYLKAVESDNKDTASLVHLATCYRILRDYDNAETYYAKASAIPGMPARVYFYYGEILKNNGKIDEARSEFLKATILQPSDSNSAREVRYCDRLKRKFYVAYVVKTINNINSTHTEFSPTLYNDDLVFVSDKDEDLVNNSSNKATGGNFYKIWTAHPGKDGFEKPKVFSISVNKTEPEFNLGPVTFSSDGKTMFFTQVAAVRKKNFINRAQLFYCIKDGNSWSKPQPFQYNSDSYSVMDAALSDDGKTLVFASDMPGGFGGCDLYISTSTANGNWSKPKNMGSEINTPGNEVFPCFRKDGQLFFSSDRHFNYGGLDIFSSTVGKDGKWSNVQNLGPDINSSTDDFGICFNSNGRTGYFSSNRKGGSGLDDIYSFIFIGDYRPLKGMVLFSANVNDPVPNVEVHLIDASGKVIKDGKTDNNGGFLFTQLEPDQKYLVKINEDDPRFAGKKKFYLADSTGRIVGVTLLNDKAGKFVFTSLPPDLTTLPKLDATDPNVNLAGNLLQGDSSKPMAGVKVKLMNGGGNVIQTATTNAFGAFVFTNLPPDENYSFQVEAPADTKFNGKTKIVLTDKSGNTIKTFYMGSDGKFNFQILASDTTALSHMEVLDPELRMEFKQILLSDVKAPLPNIKVTVVTKSGAVLQTTITDHDGVFSFTNLPADQSDMIQVDASDPKISKMKKLYITDSKKSTMRELDLNNGAFKYEFLPADKQSMGSIYVNDPWLEALNLKNNKAKDSLFIVENVYYDYQKADILPAASRVLDKVVKVMKSDPSLRIQLNAYTDPRGSDDFNMQLSQKRADAAVTYIVSHGVERWRVTGKGFGKTHPVNNCGDPNVHCTEDQFAANRRTEFKLTRSKWGK